MAQRERDAETPSESRTLATPLLLTIFGIGAAIVGGVAMIRILDPSRHHDKIDDGSSGPNDPANFGLSLHHRKKTPDRIRQETQHWSDVVVKRRK